MHPPVLVTVGRPRSALRAFLRSEAAGGMLLIAAAMIAMVAANSALADDYFRLLSFEIGPVLTPKLGPMTVLLWINDGLMSLFFLLVGLEIKREFVDGHLATWADRRLPFIAAAAGMVVPALVYLAVTGAEPGLTRGWAIPAATDIAFALGLLALLGKRAPASLKLLLTTIAIVDDVGAVAIIAFFYTAELNMAVLGAAAAVWALALVLGRRAVSSLWPYLLLGALLWYLVLLSGIHPTVAGVLLALVIPYRRTLGTPDSKDSTLHRLEHLLGAPVAYTIVPVFGFANAGVDLSGATGLFEPLPMGVALGLFVGKQIGVFGALWVAVRLRIAAKPSASWLQLYGMALLTGIGFTMSLFIGGLAFANPNQADGVKLGVLAGSLLSAVAGFVVLRSAGPRNHRPIRSPRNDLDGDARVRPQP